MGRFAERNVSQELGNKLGRPGTMDLQQSPGKVQGEGLELESGYTMPHLVFG